MKNETKLPPRPWHWEFIDGRLVALGNDEEDVLLGTSDLDDRPFIDMSADAANYILTAVNAHDDFKAALTLIAEHKGKTLLGPGTYEDGANAGFEQLAAIAENALQKAKP